MLCFVFQRVWVEWRKKKQKNKKPRWWGMKKGGERGREMKLGFGKSILKLLFQG